jgi:GxxExxY protein
MHENDVSAVVLDAAIGVHRALGPGLLESVYEVALAHVLRQRGLRVARQVPISITFEGITFDEGFRADLIVENLVLIELKSLERVAPVHKKVVLTYLRLSGLRLGLLINFGAPVLKEGYDRVVNDLDEQDHAERAEPAERPSRDRAPN